MRHAIFEIHLIVNDFCTSQEDNCFHVCVRFAPAAKQKEPLSRLLTRVGSRNRKEGRAGAQTIASETPDFKCYFNRQ